MTMFGQSPIPIRGIGTTTTVKQAIKSACQSIYGEKPFLFQVAAYEYSTLLMYSVNAFSRSEINPADVNFDSMKSAFLNSMPESGYQPIDIILGRISYPAPSSAKFLITLHTWGGKHGKARERMLQELWHECRRGKPIQSQTVL